MSSGSRSHFATVAEQWMRERPDLDVRNMVLAVGLMRMGRMIDYAYDRKCRDLFDVSGPEMRVMLALRRSGRPFALRPTDLFRALLITSGAVTKQVDRLVTKKYVARLPDPTHGGGFLVQLTREGLRTVDRATDEILAKGSPLNGLLAKLNAEQRTAGEEFVKYLIEGLEALHFMDPEALAEDKKQIPTLRSSSPRTRARRKDSKESAA